MLGQIQVRSIFSLSRSAVRNRIENAESLALNYLKRGIEPFHPVVALERDVFKLILPPVIELHRHGNFDLLPIESANLG